jgi:hypothetical protein
VLEQLDEDRCDLITSEAATQYAAPAGKTRGPPKL